VKWFCQSGVSPPSRDVWYRISHSKIILEVLICTFGSVVCLPAIDEEKIVFYYYFAKWAPCVKMVGLAVQQAVRLPGANVLR
jgi:hypothetical protein